MTYSHRDHLSARVETNSAGITARTFGQLPFGEVWYETGTASKWKFTSYERDAESGLDYAVFRSNSSRLGRFMTPDLLAGNIFDPQSLNRYSYVGNIPNVYIDPLGLVPCVPGVPGYEDDCPPPPDDYDPTSPYGGGGHGVYRRAFLPVRNEGGGTQSYSVNLKVLNDCLQSLGIPVEVVAVKVTTPGGEGYAIGLGTDFYSRSGQNVPIVVANDASTYSAAQLGQLGTPGGVAYGWTPNPGVLGSPYQNFTNNNNNAFGTVRTQVHELGHSLFNIVAGSSLVPQPNGEVGQALQDCVEQHGGIQRSSP